MLLVQGIQYKHINITCICNRFMDTSLIDCEIYPKFVRVTIKNKVIQI